MARKTRYIKKCWGTTVVVQSDIAPVRCNCLACRENRRSERNDFNAIVDRMFWLKEGVSMTHMIQTETDIYELNS